MRRDVFQAIADPTRRTILDIVSKQSLSINEISQKFEISRPAISKQIKILNECGLLNIYENGRERICEAKLNQLVEVSDWVEKHRIFWTNKLDSLEEFLNNNK